MTIQNFLEIIKELCFKFSVGFLSRRETHKKLLSQLKDIFTQQNYITILEYPITFKYLKIKDKSIWYRQWYIDLFCYNSKYKIAIEFDSWSSLKYKSIEKLIQVDSNMSIGIIKWNLNRENTPNNINRIIETKEKLNSNKGMWLININQKRIDFIE